MARRPNAYSQLIQEGNNPAQPEAAPSASEDGDTAKPQNSNTVTQQSSNTAKNRITVKVTFYPSQEQMDKLYEFMEAYRKRTGMKINQQDLLRRIIDVADINTVLP
jgi:hypothetical protein